MAENSEVRSGFQLFVAARAAPDGVRRTLPSTEKRSGLRLVGHEEAAWISMFASGLRIAEVGEGVAHVERGGVVAAGERFEGTDGIVLILREDVRLGRRRRRLD